MLSSVARYAEDTCLFCSSAWSGENRLNTIRREKILITTGIACPDTASTPQADIAIRKQDLVKREIPKCFEIFSEKALNNPSRESRIYR